MPRFDRITRFDFRLLVGEEEHALDTLEEKDFVERWAAGPGRKHLQGGPFIDIEGVPWADDGTCDELWMTMAWFHAADALADGAEVFGDWKANSRAVIGPWEESNLVWRRFGDVLEMEDLHPSGQIAMRRVRVAYPDFMVLLAGHANELSATMRALNNYALELHTDAPEPVERLLSALLVGDDLALLDRVAERWLWK